MTQDGAARAGGYRGWLLAIGIALSLISAGYLVLYAFNHQVELRAMQLGADGLLWATVAGMLYAAGLLFVAIGWLAAVRACRDATPARSVLGVALVSQIGKYVPGNIAQHVSKAVYAGSRGMSLRVVAKSTLLELVSMVIAGAIVAVVGGVASALFAPLLAPAVGSLLTYWHVALLAGAALCAVLLAVLWPRMASMRAALSFAPAATAATVALHVACISLLGLSFYAIVAAFTDALSLAFCVALFSTAWLLGFVTPGAPAGLGVRETILVIGLSGPLGPMALPAAILHRLISALADAVMALVGALVLKTGQGPLKARRAPVTGRPGES